jgi:hypothetical protein
LQVSEVAFGTMLDHWKVSYNISLTAGDATKRRRK